MYLTGNKRNMRNLLSKRGLVVPKGYAIKRTDKEPYWIEVFEALKKPLVVKPNKGSQGKGITVGIESLFEYRMAVKKSFEHARKKNAWVIVEEEQVGFDEYRVLVTNEQVIGVIQRVPANVVGDGTSSIKQLIRVKNSDPRRGEAIDHPPLFRIKFDSEMKEFLSKRGLTGRSVPQKNQRVYLRGVSNISMGGDSLDFTDKAHPSVEEICLKAINAIPGLSLGGVDFMTTDITAKQDETTYSILEVNNSPGIDIHDFPFEGKNRRAGQAFLRELFADS